MSSPRLQHHSTPAASTRRNADYLLVTSYWIGDGHFEVSTTCHRLLVDNISRDFFCSVNEDLSLAIGNHPFPNVSAAKS
ncbi:unnamed protein product [Angiostrongylus costaricensis]|uniref:Uncharacterized protein n=1 Tax=Angiostrongylus costaricensis TaxID=334426 RepID=A0A0R3PNT4_ANGCS|nr:unnamed protein product [Angiostrongylus costaricensis]